MRECPAAGRGIEAAECAIGRHTTYACPESCRFNAFSAEQYPGFRSIEESAEAKFFTWVLENVPDRAKYEARMKRTLGKSDGPPTAYYHLLAWHGVYQTGADGETVIGKWEKAGFPGLNADERIVMRGKARACPAFLEAHRVMDDRRVEVVDLLDPQRKPLLVVDQGLARQAVRFGVYFVSLVPLPHYYRLFGACTMIPHHHPLTMEEVIYDTVKHLGGPADEPGIRRWLAENGEKFEEAMMAVGLARRQLLFASLDAKVGKAIYSLERPYKECVDRLATVAEIAGDSIREEELKEGFHESRAWFAGPEDKESQLLGKGAVVGRILLGETHWRVEAMGAERLARLRQRFESLLQERVKFAGERLDDIGARLRMAEPKYNPALVPPTLLREPPRMTTALSRVEAPSDLADKEAIAAAYVHERQRGILDEPIPALDNQTPRAAAKNPALREKLLLWLKFWIYQTDAENLRTGGNEDCNWMVRDLGLTEILFDPPPPRSAVRDDPESDVEDDDDEGPWRDLPLPPALPKHPWSAEEASEALSQAVKAFPPPEHPADYFNGLKYPFFVDLNMALDKLMNDIEVSWAFQYVARAVLCIAPRGTRPPEVRTNNLYKHLNKHMERLADLASEHSEAGFSDWIKQSRQPALLSLLLAMAFTQIEKAEPDTQMRAQTTPLFVVVLLASVDALDEAARQN